jgi:hypothetical protein
VQAFGMAGLCERQVGSAVWIGAFESGAGDKLFGDGFELVEPLLCYST